MTRMIRLAVKLVMVWLLLGPPALCRAGVLVQCCDHESEGTPDPSDSVASPCCADEGSDSGSSDSAPDSTPRRCGTCAGVCASVAKPTDDSNSTTLAAFLVPPTNVVTVAAITRVTNMSRLSWLTSLPFPPSDLPLLI